MAASKLSTICCTCREETTTYSCPGCSNYFCFDDLAAHRESLKPQFHEIENQRNDFMQILNNQHRTIHPLINQINQWEQMSIEKIQKTANEQREFVQQVIHEHGQKIHIELNILTEEMQKLAKRKDFNEMSLNKLRTQLESLEKQLNQPTRIQIIENSTSAYINKLLIIVNSSSSKSIYLPCPQLKANLKWKQYAKTIAGGNERGNELNQFNCPYGIDVHHREQAIYVADCYNHRIIKWKLGENYGEIVAGGNGCGVKINQLDEPTDVIVDENSKSLIICDNGNRRIVRWSLENPEDKEIIIDDINCWGLMMNQNGDLFVSDRDNHVVKRWRRGEKGDGTIVAGGNEFNQLRSPTFIFVDREDTVYISESNLDNNRVLKWRKDANEGIVVAGGQGCGNSLRQLNNPRGLIVNEVGDVYVADSFNHRIMCWPSGATEGRVVVDGQESNQFKHPVGLSFDAANNLYVVDQSNNRIQLFEVDEN